VLLTTAGKIILLAPHAVRVSKVNVKIFANFVPSMNPLAKLVGHAYLTKDVRGILAGIMAISAIVDVILNFLKLP